MPPFIVSVAPLSTISDPVPVSVPPLQVLLPVNSKVPLPCNVPPERIRLGMAILVLKFAVPPDTVTFCSDGVPPASANVAVPPDTVMFVAYIAAVGAIFAVPLLTVKFPVSVSLPFKFTVAPSIRRLATPARLDPVLRFCVPPP